MVVYLTCIFSMLGFARKMLHGLNSNILSLASYSRKGPLRGTYARLLCGRIPLHTRRNLPIPADTRRYLPIPTDTHRYPLIPADTRQYPPIPANTRQYPLIPADTLGRYLGLVRDFFEAFSILPDGLTDTQTHTHTHVDLSISNKMLYLRKIFDAMYLSFSGFPTNSTKNYHIDCQFFQVVYMFLRLLVKTRKVWVLNTTYR